MAINITRSGAVVNISIADIQKKDLPILISMCDQLMDEANGVEETRIDYKNHVKISNAGTTEIREQFREDYTSLQPTTYPSDTKVLIDNKQILPALTPTEEEDDLAEEFFEQLTPAAAPVNMGVVLDNDGLPWDARIHSSKKTKTPDGKWRLMRGVNPETVQVVKNELRATMNLPPAPVKTAGVAVAVPPPPPTGNVAAALFAALVNKVTAALGAHKLTQVQLVQVCQSVGLANLPAAASRPDLIPRIDEKLTAIIGG